MCGSNNDVVVKYDESAGHLLQEWGAKGVEKQTAIKIIMERQKKERPLFTSLLLDTLCKDPPSRGTSTYLNKISMNIASLIQPYDICIYLYCLYAS